MQIIMDQKDICQTVDDGANIPKRIAEIDGVSKAAVINEKSKEITLLNEVDILNDDLTDDGSILIALNESSMMESSEEKCSSKTSNFSHDGDSNSCVKISGENDEFTEDNTKICESNVSSVANKADTYQIADSEKDPMSRGTNKTDSTSGTLEKTLDVSNDVSTECIKDCDNAKDNCKSLNEDKVIEKTTITSLVIKNTQVAAVNTIDITETNIIIPVELGNEKEAVSSVDKENVTISSVNADIIDDKVEETTETIEYNIVERMDVDDDKEVDEKSALNIVEVRTASKSDVIQLSSNGSACDNKSDIKTLQAERQSSSEALKPSQVDNKSGNVENGECALDGDLSEKVNEVKLLEKKELPSVDKKRSVIEDIFDDWTDETPDEDSVLAKPHDDVEQELKSLLEDDKSIKIIDDTSHIAAVSPTKNVSSVSALPKILKSENLQDVNVTPKSKENSIKLSAPLSPKKVTSPGAPLNSPQNVMKKTLILQTKCEVSKQVDLVGVSPIKSTAEITKVLKNFKDKEFDSPRKEIIIVKKVKTKQVDNPASVISPLPQLIALDTIEKTSIVENKTHVDNKELLAILEGDEDPDWSDLTPPKLIEEPKNSDIIVERNSPPKLDPLIERELALKQLLELPATPKKMPAKKKLIAKPTRGRPPKEQPIKESRGSPKKIVNIDLVEKESGDSPSGKSKLVSIDLTSPDDNQDIKTDETRSGRKRRPTEKAREHEISAKRQKVVKNKNAPKKMVKDSGTDDESKSGNVIENNIAIEEKDAISDDIDDDVITKTQKTDFIIIQKEKTVGEQDEIIRANDSSTGKTPKESLTKKSTQTSAKGKVQSVKKSPIKTLPKKSSKLIKNTRKNADGTTTDIKPKKKIINEIDRLLQDEGVVNLLYDVEQPGKKRLVPVTKSQAKVMDIQKVQRELKIRTKLVRNAVLRLRTSSTAPSNVTPRSKRSISHNYEQQSPQTPEKKSSQDPTKSPRSSVTSPTDFLYPARIRNAADASIIVRRHSSSSFSSASGSPRVSIDGAERQALFDGGKIDDNHTLRSNKRRLSQEDKKKYLSEAKKSKKEMVNDVTTLLPKGKISPIKTSKKAVDSKRTKVGKQDTFIDDDETMPEENTTINTRSNGATGKSMKNNKKTPKTKVSFARENENELNDEPTEQDDALSACLAEAVTALANDSGRTRTTTMSRKTKTRAFDPEGSRAKDKMQFSNKEINVQRHGNLVQLILTPSTQSKIRNGITLQMMQEFREALTILKKDDDCRVVLLTSTGSSFCEGLDLSALLQDNKDARRLHAQELANCVKDFIKSLATFNKPIVAGVQGSAVGLGVTMLPLFDLVIASDKASFSTPYGKLGQIAEGAAIFTLSHVLGSAVTSELLLGGRTLTANEALRAGLVTRVLWPDRFQVELLPSLRAMSEQSSQSMEATKTLLRHSLRKKLDAALESESYLLVQHWCSEECQDAMRAYMDEKVQ